MDLFDMSSKKVKVHTVIGLVEDNACLKEI